MADCDTCGRDWPGSGTRCHDCCLKTGIKYPLRQTPVARDQMQFTVIDPKKGTRHAHHR